MLCAVVWCYYKDQSLMSFDVLSDEGLWGGYRGSFSNRPLHTLPTHYPFICPSPWRVCHIKCPKPTFGSEFAFLVDKKYWRTMRMNMLWCILVPTYPWMESKLFFSPSRQITALPEATCPVQAQCFRQLHRLTARPVRNKWKSCYSADRWGSALNSPSTVLHHLLMLAWRSILSVVFIL